jgi:hypothetical protein
MVALLSPSLLLSVTARAETVQATSAGMKPLAESLSGEALAEYDAAKLVFEDGDPAAAATKFKRAYELSRDPRLLWNIAVCEKEQRHYAEASSLVTRYLEEASAQLSEDSRAQAQATLDSLRQYSSEVELKAVPQGAIVFVDGEQLGTTPLATPLFLDLGVRELEVRVPGYLPFKTKLDVPGEQKMEVAVKLEKDSSSARLNILTNHPKSIITVDGTTRGSEHWEGGLAPGKHQLRVTAPGMQSYNMSVELAAQSSRTMEIALKDKKSNPWPWIAGGAALVAGATVGGILLFGKEKEPKVEGEEGDLGTIPLRFPFR